MKNSYIQEEAKNAYDKFVGKGKILGISVGHREELKKFSDIQKKLSAYNNSLLGIQNVPLSKIVGSVQKTEDFKKGFIPKNSIVKIRWCNIYIEMLGDFKLPPVDLYKIRDEYYVYDGNHRISVANFLNFSSIEAIVTEFFSGEDTEEDLNYREQFKFTKQTQLNLDLTESGDYKKLLYDIKSLDGHHNLIEKSRYWYQNIYTPIMEILRFNGMVLEKKLEGDLYIKYLEHRKYLINNTKKSDYSYAIIDYLNMIYLQKKYTIQTQIKINYYIDSLIRRLYKLDKEKSMENIQKDKLLGLRELIRGDFTDELYFSKVIRRDIRSWYYAKVRTTLDIFRDKSRSFGRSKLIQKNQLKLYRELKDYMNYYKIKYSNVSTREGVLDYILEVLIPTFDYLSHKKIDEDEFISQYFKLSHRKIKFLKIGKNIGLEELEDLYLDIGSESSTIQDWLSKTLKKEKTFKGDILKGVKELLLIKEQDVETFGELMDLYEGTTNYKTILHIKKQIWNFIEQRPSDDWVKDKFAVDLEKLTHNKEGLKFFKTERFMHFIKGKSNTYTIVDFYMDIINYKEKNDRENTIDIDTLLMHYINRSGEKMIKAIMLDLDGTLLDNVHKISETNKEILKKLEDRGIKIFLATGRSYESMRSYYEELNLTTPAICYNGAKIIYPNGSEKEYPLKEGSLKTLIEIAREYKTHLNLYQHEIWYSENIKNEETEIYKDISGLEPVEKDFDRLNEMFSTKALYIGEHENLLKIEKDIKEKLGDSVYTTFSKPFFLEILDGNVNKGTAMKNIMEVENISLSHVIAFGDGLNDKEMLETAGVGVAMDGAFPELKKVADHVTISNNESGVGEFLKKYL